jgi:hypothetical protein
MGFAQDWNVATNLDSIGFARFAGPFATFDEASSVASGVVDACRLDHDLPPLAVIGDFLVPAPGAEETRDFQTLHFDFGIPLNPMVEHDVARYTALYIPTDVGIVHAVTRLVPLEPLLRQRSWPPLEELVDLFASYGRTHGAWDDGRGYVEGSLARLVEAAAASPPVLPSVKVDTNFLCGMEFTSLAAEVMFFERLGLRVYDVAIDVSLQPGELLVFNNLSVAHGRRGVRQPGELHQLVFGHKLQPADQVTLRDNFLIEYFDGRDGVPPTLTPEDSGCIPGPKEVSSTLGSAMNVRFTNSIL